MNRRSKTILISGGITFTTTIIVLLICIDDWKGLTGWAFAAIMCSEIVLFGGLIFAEWFAKKTDQLILRSSICVIIVTYAVINFLISICYMALSKDATTSFAVIQIIILAVASLSIVISVSVSKGVHKSNGRTMKAVENAEAMIERLDKLALCPECDDFASTIRKISEDLRFTDISKTVVEDAEISNIICTIENEVDSTKECTHETIKASLIRLNTLTSQRKNSVNVVNKGKI